MNAKSQFGAMSLVFRERSDESNRRSTSVTLEFIFSDEVFINLLG
jgi:hypothetical protein